MKMKILALFGIAVLLAACPGREAEVSGKTSGVSFEDYTVASTYLLDPDKAVPYMRLCADFWKRSYDSAHGGFFTNVAEDGTPQDKGGIGLSENFKTTLTQSRNAYGFVRAYMVTGDRTYLDYARKAVDFLAAHAWDKTHGGFHSVMYADGRNADQDARFDLYHIKWSFTQHYALLGIAALYDATRSDQVRTFLLQGREAIDTRLWDSRPGVEGYFDKAAYDWSSPSDKGFTPTVDGITTHGEALHLLFQEDAYTARFLALADDIIDHLVPTVAERKLGFAESFDSTWQPKNDGFLFIGHVLKSAWCLGRAYLVDPKPAYREAAELLMKEVWEKAWDKENGGPYNLGDSQRGVVTDNNKNWWTLEQAINAGLILYYITGDKLYLKMADETVNFYMEHLVDWEHGDVYQESDNAGIIHTTPVKGDIWKAAYHSLETGWFLYLYGHLYLNRTPVTLYYWLERAATEQTITLNPLTIRDGTLRIQSVALNGKPTAEFDGAARRVTLPAGFTGELKVTFAVAEHNE